MGAIGYLRPVGRFARQRGLHRSPALRRLAFRMLAMAGKRDVTIVHHWVPGARMRLNLFRHRGYWFHGKRREHNVMASFARLMKPGDSVIEIGGHIGYISVYLGSLVGPEGKVLVMEPSPDNLHYLRSNVAGHPQIEIVEQAASDENGTADFFVEDLSGQNSTLVKDYGNLAQNRAGAFTDADYRPIQVETVTLDTVLERHDVRPAFIKIDVEGAELMALRGMTRCLSEHRPSLMVEVTEHEGEVMRLLADAGYAAFDGKLAALARGAPVGPNRFFIPAEQAV